MKTSYNPFNKKDHRETEHGIINFQHDMGTCYVTNRTPEHIFRKYGAFCISNTELETCYDNHVYWILILYHNNNGETIPHRIELNKLRYMDTHNQNGDVQTIIPIKQMEKRGEEGWQ